MKNAIRSFLSKESVDDYVEQEYGENHTKQHIGPKHPFFMLFGVELHVLPPHTIIIVSIYCTTRTRYYLDNRICQFAYPVNLYGNGITLLQGSHP
jgi:hypothetical protein